VLGLTSVPRAGDKFLVASDDRTARQIAEKRQAAERNAQLAKTRKKVSLEDLQKILEQGAIETLNLILKGDVSGSVEALEDALLKVDVGDDVDLRIIHRGVGSITEHDVTLASASEAIIIGFNVRPEGRARELSDREGVDRPGALRRRQQLGRRLLLHRAVRHGPGRPLGRSGVRG